MRRLLFSASVVLIFAAGCSRPPDPPPPAATPRASASPAILAASALVKPLLSAAREHPAPPDTPGVDAAETLQAARPNGASENLRLGLAYYKVAAWEQAVTALEAAARLAPQSSAPLFYLGYAQMAQGGLAQAAQTFEKAAALSQAGAKEKSEAYLEVGSCRYALGDDKAARDAFAKSLAADKTQGMASLALGTLTAAEGKGHATEARAYFSRAARDLPAGPKRAQALGCLGLLAETEKNVKEALTEYQKALALDKSNIPAKAGLARLDPVKPPAK